MNPMYCCLCIQERKGWARLLDTSLERQKYLEAELDRTRNLAQALTLQLEIAQGDLRELRGGQKKVLLMGKQPTSVFVVPRKPKWA